MFKIEVNVSGVTKHHYWMNKHADDFIKFLPAQFTKEYGETITKTEITVYKIDEANKDILEGKIRTHENNQIDCTEVTKIKVIRYDVAKYALDDYVRLAEFSAAKAAREAIFSDAVTIQTVTVLSTVQFDFGSGLEDAVQLTTGHELISDNTSVELTLTGTALSPAWPYDISNNFLGNN